MSAIATRKELQERLNRFQRNLPFLLKQHAAPADFALEIVGYAFEFAADASEKDRPWVLEELVRLLRQAGLPAS
jgi:hypothetical protein